MKLSHEVIIAEVFVLWKNLCFLGEMLMLCCTFKKNFQC